MTGEKRFELDGNGRESGDQEKKEAPAPSPGQQTPTAPLPKVGERKPSVGPGARRTRPRAGKKRRKQTSEAVTLPFLFRPGVLLFLGALLLAALWAGGLFDPEPGPLPGWAWQHFQNQEGGFALRWGAAPVYAGIGALLAAFFLIASFVPSSPGRGRAILVLAALGVVPFWPGNNAHLIVAAALLGIAGGTLVARNGAGAGRGIVFFAVALLAAGLCLPLLIGESHVHHAGDLWVGLFGEGGGIDALLDARNALLVALFGLLAIGILTWLGLGGRWALWTTGILLLIGVLAPLVLLFIDLPDSARDGSWDEVFRILTASLASAVTAFLALSLPIAAGVLDVTRRDRS